MSEGTVQQRVSSDGITTDQNMSQSGTSDASLEKVRDILFGVQSREFDKRFARIEDRISKETTDLRTELKSRLGELESFIRSEIEALGDRLRGEQTDRSNAVKDVARELRDLDSNIAEKTSRIEESLSKSSRDLREQIFDQSKRLSDDIQRRFEEVTSSLNSQAFELRDEKADRAGLAALFTEMAMRLRNEFKLPDVEATKRDG